MLLHRRMLVLVVGVALALAVAFVLPKVSTAQAPDPVVDRNGDSRGVRFPSALGGDG
jgi:hypothetical protein